ncbi:MAG: hypothetical protein ACI4VB_06210 [Bradymonadia bacterium]
MFLLETSSPGRSPRPPASIVLAEMRRFVVNFVVAVGHGTSAAPSGASSFPRIAIISAARC